MLWQMRVFPSLLSITDTYHCKMNKMYHIYIRYICTTKVDVTGHGIDFPCLQVDKAGSVVKKIFEKQPS